MSLGKEVTIGDGLEFSILRPLLPEFWDHCCEPSHPAEKEPGILPLLLAFGGEGAAQV